MDLERHELDAEQIFRILAEHSVEYVVIGGIAAVLQGSPTVTFDADICPSRSHDNLERLATALVELGATLRVPNEAVGVSFEPTAVLLTQMEVLPLRTRLGDLDIVLVPAGTTGYDELVDRALTLDVRGVVVSVASLDDVIRSKERADRDKDRAVLPVLYALRDEIAKQERSG